MERSRYPQAEPHRRTGGRSARVVRDVLDAAVDVLAHAGYAALSFDEVATRAGVSRTTVYRRWPSKQDLVRAALLRIADQQLAGPDTGSLRQDLIAALELKLSGPHADRDASLFRVVMAEFDDPELTALARILRERVLQPFVAAVERAVARGELPRGQDPLLILDPVLMPVHLKHALFREKVERRYVEALVDIVMAGANAVARAGHGTGKSPDRVQR
jgi:AcrR family transcriptional regulator